ncbi:hypothetical protein [Methanobrevibacter sp.]|uniref:hypothetical protein n=1 Tax=Methanobrevibacter sp. TaxID=66852 RepID=UPI0025CDBA43|nr:hypothetical protein [Methanobrevibacter sp.]
MKLNKTIIVGLILILFSGLLFVTNIFNPIIRPITYIFLMGSSKGKDIMFFGLLGLFLILSQVIKKDIDVTKYLKISIVIGSITLVFGILLEVIFRLQMGIKLNTIFASMTSTMTTTSILHTHLIKAILGEVLTKIIGPFIQTDINTGVSLYQYLPSFSFLIIILLPTLFITIVLASQKRPWFSNLLLAFFSSCLIIGIIDGGLFGTPAIVGIMGIYLVYRNGYYITRIAGKIFKDENLLKENEKYQPPYRNKGLSKKRRIFNHILVYIVVIGIIFLRFTIAFAGAEPDCYTVDVINATEDEIDLGNISDKVISVENHTDLNKITYLIDPSYNEMQLLNDLKVPLNDSCEYYTVSWNIYSYL